MTIGHLTHRIQLGDIPTLAGGDDTQQIGILGQVDQPTL